MKWETVVYILSPAIALISAVLIYIRGRRADDNDDQRGFMIILQEDNKELRRENAEKETKLDACLRQVNRLIRRHGENGDTPPKGTPTTKE